MERRDESLVLVSEGRGCQDWGLGLPRSGARKEAVKRGRKCGRLEERVLSPSL